ncbi:MAG: hypothetical protein LBM77_08500, partial [Spirochaetaceae bacterium]|nr:hypothetical protein [Spirochaetaceae bacterium]
MKKTNFFYSLILLCALYVTLSLTSCPSPFVQDIFNTVIDALPPAITVQPEDASYVQGAPTNPLSVSATSVDKG